MPVSIKLQNLFFEDPVEFELYGGLSVDHCRFVKKRNPSENMRVQIHRGKHEATPTIANVKDLHSNTQLTVSITNSIFTRALYIQSSDVARAIQIENCSLNGAHVDVHVGNRVTSSDLCPSHPTLSVFSLRNLTFHSGLFMVQSWQKNTFTLIQLTDSSFTESGIYIYSHDGQFQFGFHMEDCTFIGKAVLYHRYFISINSALGTSIKRTKFFLQNSHIDCAIQVKENTYATDEPSEDVQQFLIFDQRIPLPFHFIGIWIENTDFIGTAGASSSGIICASYANITLSSCSFTVQRESIIPTVGGLITLKWGAFKATQVTFDMSALESQYTSVSVVSIYAEILQFETTYVLCPASFGAVESFGKNPFEQKHFICKKVCDQTQYTSDAGTLLVNGVFDFDQQNITAVKTKVSCFPCPVGATCEDNIKALPDFWGHRNEGNFVTMIRCPDGYCCHCDETCAAINSCNSRRTGILCGTCEKNFTEALFSSKCVPYDHCNFGLVLTLYWMCAVGYGTTLLGIGVIRTKLLDLLRSIYKKCKRKSSSADRQVSTGKKTSEEGFHEQEEPGIKDKGNGSECSREVEQTSGEQGTKEAKPWNITATIASVSQEEDTGMKYMQILFYYVQDASLFKVQLPNTVKKEEGLIFSILQFSPGIISTIYTNITELCFSEGNAPITKVLLSSLFGPCVAVFLLCIYLFQKVLSKFARTQSHFWPHLRGYLMRAFLLTILLSYQKIVTGVFTLVHCVDVGSNKVLHIQGDINCYTWWQTLIHIYLCLCVFPVFLVLSHCPFYVKDKTMSERMFVLVCLFPIPVLTWHQIQKVRRARQTPEEGQDSIHMTVKQSVIDVGSSPENDPDRLSADKTSAHDSDTHQSDCENDTDNFTEEHEIQHTLLRHYKTLSFCGVRFTWLGVHKLYRFALVALNTYIQNPAAKLAAMSVLLLMLALANSTVKPYRDRKANFTASCSYILNIVFAMINLWKSALLLFDCKNNCSLRDAVIQYNGIIEGVLLVHIPVIAMCLWVVTQGFQKCMGKTDLHKKLC